jgi:hypothetical protein
LNWERGGGKGGKGGGKGKKRLNDMKQLEVYLKVLIKECLRGVDFCPPFLSLVWVKFDMDRTGSHVAECLGYGGDNVCK